jgi:hypothetical protein
VKILLDESVSVQVRNALNVHQVSTAVEMGRRGIGNGKLLQRSESNGFQLLIVADKNFQHENHFERIRMAAESAAAAGSSS